ncbi:MAG: hypothetical protein D6738_00950 [Acidobacteria bacterium]|nr:MAG: hypothetical protein D6738_00950 [Acidobacteriota bacterium]
MRGPIILLAMACAAAGTTGSVPAHPTDESCLECHADHAFDDASHPLGVPAPAQLGDRLPTVRGLVACVTCHRGHAEPAPVPDETGGEFMLRARPEVLCAACHREASGRWDRPHALYADTIHGGARPALGGRRVADAGQLDLVSRRCLACHDDTHGAAVPYAVQASGTLGRSHPIGVMLASLGTPVAPAPRAEDLAREGVRLFDGRVGCGSCHRLFSRRPARLAMEMERSRLCLSCHAI